MSHAWRCEAASSARASGFYGIFLGTLLHVGRTGLVCAGLLEDWPDLNSTAIEPLGAAFQFSPTGKRTCTLLIACPLASSTRWAGCMLAPSAQGSTLLVFPQSVFTL